MRTPETPDSRGGRLRKLSPTPHHGRSVSAQLSTPSETYRNTYLDGTTSNTASPLAPPHHPRGDLQPNSRSSSFDLNRSRPGTPTSHSRPMTPTLNLPEQDSSRPSTPGGSKDRKKSGFLHKKKKDQEENTLPLAWIAGHPQRQAYDVTGLMSGRPMPELWDDNDGNCLVYLFPRNAGKGPSFKIDSAVFASSPVLFRLAFGDLYISLAIQNGGDRRQMPLDARTQGLSLHDPTTPPRSPRQRHASGCSLGEGDSGPSVACSHDTDSHIRPVSELTTRFCS